MTDTAPPAVGEPSGRTRRSGQETRERLRRAAAEVFAERGYEGAGVQEIARRAGVTTGAIYSRYSGKAELLAEAISHRASPELDALFAAEHPRGKAADLIARAGEHLVTREANEQGGVLLEAFVAARRDPELHALLREHLAERAAVFGRIIDFAKSHGDVDESLDTRSVVHFCQAVALGFLLYEAIDSPRPEAEAWHQLVERLVGALAPSEEIAHDPKGDRP